MSPVALVLNLSLGALLIGALILGVRLDRKLRALREAHNGFAKAVSELDQAAQRTQAGLTDLKTTAEDTRAVLAERIQVARALSSRLEKMIEDAEVSAKKLTERPASRTPVVLRELSVANEAAKPAVQARPVVKIKPEPEAKPAPRSRATVDDELFEAACPPLAFAGGRR